MLLLIHRWRRRQILDRSLGAAKPEPLSESNSRVIVDAAAGLIRAELLEEGERAFDRMRKRQGLTEKCPTCGGWMKRGEPCWGCFVDEEGDDEAEDET